MEKRSTSERTGSARNENMATQPRFEHPVFNNTAVLTEAWYPALPSKNLAPGKTATFKILDQRLVLFRGEDGIVRALDAFCPHMGADLIHGEVEGSGLRCYFHRWKFAADGNLVDIPCSRHLPSGARLASYPTAERYGLVWVYAGPEARHEIPVPPGLDGDDVDWVFVKKCVLYAHHHVMMANGLDLQHFDAVHGLDIKFDFRVEEKHPQIFDWTLRGDLPVTGWRSRFARWLLGPSLGYRVRIAGGSIAAITYGDGARFRGTGMELPSLHVLWGCIPRKSGVSEIRIFFVTKKQRGPFAIVRKWMLATATLALVAILRDDDVKAFPNMRFDMGALIPADGSVVKLAQMINRLPVSPWTPRPPLDPKRSPMRARAQTQP